MRESKIEKALVKAVKAAGGEVRKLTFPGRRGAPDRLVMLPGRRPVLVEVKTLKGRVSKLQEREHEVLRGWFDVLVIWTLADIREVFE